MSYKTVCLNYWGESGNSHKTPRNISIYISLRILLGELASWIGETTFFKIFPGYFFWRCRKTCSEKIYKWTRTQRKGGTVSHTKDTPLNPYLWKISGGIATRCSEFYPSSSLPVFVVSPFVFLLLCHIMLVISSPTGFYLRVNLGRDNNAYTFTWPSSFFSFPFHD